MQVEPHGVEGREIGRIRHIDYTTVAIVAPWVRRIVRRLIA